MENDERDPSYSDEEEITYSYKKITNKSVGLITSDDEEYGSNVVSKPHENQLDNQSSDSGLDDNSSINNTTENPKKFSRVKRYNTSDSEDDDSSNRKHLSDNEKYTKSSQDSLTFPNVASQDSGSEKVAEHDSGLNSPKKSSSSNLFDNDSPPKKKNFENVFQDDIYDAEGSSDEEKQTTNSRNESGETSVHKEKSTDDIYDAEGSSDEGRQTTNSRNKAGETSPVHKEKTKPAKIRSSSKKKEKSTPVSEVDEIHKETQRMIRESRVSLPYHIPKQRTLQDFLNRKQSIPKVPLKSTCEDLSVVWKHLEEREKTAESFYNSETEGSDEEITEEPPKSQNEDKHSNSSQPASSLKINDVVLSNDCLSNEIPELNSILPEKDHCCSEISAALCQTEEVNEIKNITENIDCLITDVDSNAVQNQNSKQDIASEDMETNASSSDMQESQPTNTFFGVELDFNDDSIAARDVNKAEDKLNMNSTVNESIPESTDINSESTNKEYTSESLTESLFKSLDGNIKTDEEHKEKVTTLKSQQSSSLSLIIDTSVLDKVPKLSCGPGNEIDLDQPIGGANQLLKRFIKHSKLKTTVPKEEKTVKLSVLNIEACSDGEVTSVKEEEITVSRQESKPGLKLCALKQSLKKSIEISRSQHLAKRIQQYKLYEKEFYEEVGGDPTNDVDDEFENEVFGDNDFEEKPEGSVQEADDDKDSSVSEPESDDEIEDDVDMTDKPKKKNAFLDEEAEVSDNPEEDSSSEIFDDSDSDSDPVTEESVAKAKKSLDFDLESLNRDSPIKKLDLSGLGLDKGFEEDSDLMGLCSGKFQTQPVSLTQLEEDSSQSYCASVPLQEENDNEFSQEMFSQKSVKAVKVIDSEEEDNEEVNEIKTQKSTKRLQFSDDEDDIESKQSGNDVENEDELRNIDDVISENDDEKGDDNVGNSEDAQHDEFDNSDEIDEVNEHDDKKIINYDSEEEIVEGHKFFEVEAELSGSEWGSEDEDENGLSDFEADEADMEKINQRKLKSELERIHMQELMVEDKREIRLLQELLLEDGDLHSGGPKRQRLYRWSNQDGVDSFGGKTTMSDEEGGGVDDEEEDLQWRKQRQEREKFLNSTRKENEEVDERVSMPINDKKFMKQQSATKIQSNLLTSPDPKQPFKLLTNRGSFLGRSEKVLTKLAELSGPTDQQQQRVKRNMVFSVVSPPKAKEELCVEVEKRKAEENLPRVTKKLKFNENITKSTRSLGLLQKLMESDSAT